MITEVEMKRANTSVNFGAELLKSRWDYHGITEVAAKRMNTSVNFRAEPLKSRRDYRSESEKGEYFGDYRSGSEKGEYFGKIRGRAIEIKIRLPKWERKGRILR